MSKKTQRGVTRRVSGGGAVNRISPVFKLVFLTVLALTVLSLVAAVFLSFIDPPTEERSRLIETCSTTWKMGFGAVVGLIGGKTT